MSPGSLFGFVVSISLLADPSTAALTRFETGDRLMGMDFNLTLYAPTEQVANASARAAFKRIKELNSILSDYEPDSELMRLCATAGSGQEVPVGPDLWAVLSAAHDLNVRSDGAFDVTVGPFVKLWRQTRRSRTLPTPEQIQSARDRFGDRFSRWNRQQHRVLLQKKGMQLDLGGIAVGYALDEAMQVLRNHGIKSAMLDGSGDILVSEPPPGQPGWRVGIAPLTADGPPSRFLLLKNMSVTTSGSAFQHVELHGKRYSHIVDPQTGLGMTTRSAVTVIAPTGIVADSYATAVCLLGPEKGVRLIENTPGAACLILAAEGDRISATSSARWSGFEVKQESSKP